MSFSDKAASDPKVKRLMKVNESVKSSINVTALVKEMKTMLQSRQYRNFNKRVADEYKPNIIDWAGEVAHHQGRLADISILVTDKLYHLNKLINAASKRLISEHTMGMKGSVTDKKAMVEDALSDPTATVADLERLIALIKICDKELERSYFNAQLVKSVVEIANREAGKGA